MADEIAVRLARLDACAVSDALDQLGLSPSVTGLHALSVRQRISGRVTTVRLASGKPPLGSPPRHLCTAAIDGSHAGAVVVVEQKTGVECAGWGGILSNAARGRGLSGVIVEGLARDVDESADIGFPVYGRGSTARTARGRIHEAETGGPITIGHLTVNDGDWVVADSSGAAFVPAASIEAVLSAAEAIAAKEAVMTKAVMAGRPVSQVMGATYEHLLEGKTAG
ncbi:RraA family protein [Brevundimonas diminuta]|uniref:RraA family protein n=1 Tax=Brevundimonas diminuta TaxID=293 RepID=UPI00209740DA|nr:RraA family protein [Brevundimonas diminuta]MCO8019176.1 RraA family protein [Brevundimonas diminuta]MCO8021853.1 RraA family protein [Brevundimonas diminuta]